jgi:hypothetical protein
MAVVKEPHRNVSLLVATFAWFFIACSVVFGIDSRFGIKAGADLSFVGDKNLLSKLNELDDHNDAILGADWGYSGGMYLIVGLSELFGIPLELLYSRYGANYSYISQGEEVFTWQVAHVLEVPLLLRSQIFFGSGSGALYGFIGPNVVFFLGDIILREQFEEETDISIHRPYSPAVLCLSMGLGCEFFVGDSILSFDLRLTSTYPGQFIEPAYSFSTIYVLVGYGWRL